MNREGLIYKAEKFVKKYNSEILTGIGIASFYISIGMAIKSTPKAKLALEQKQREQEEVSILDTIKAVGPHYLPTITMAVLGTGCIISGSNVYRKRNAALATMYALSDKTLEMYKDKIKETIGDNKAKKIDTAVSQQMIDDNPKDSNMVIITDNGESLCYDSISGRYFQSTIDAINKAVNSLNKDMLTDDSASLNAFYGYLGLPNITSGDDTGWSVQNGLLEVSFDATIAENDEPCIVLKYDKAPIPNFNIYFA